jgi:hypothetical protein
LEVLLTALEANAPAQQQGARCGLVFQPIRQNPAPGQVNLDIASRDETVNALIKALLVGEQLDHHRWGLISAGLGEH